MKASSQLTWMGRRLKAHSGWNAFTVGKSFERVKPVTWAFPALSTAMLTGTSPPVPPK